MKYIPLLLLLTLLSCHNKPKNFTAVSNFNLKPGVLKDNDEFKIIFCSDGGDANPEQKYLIQFVVLKVGTNDTLNILSFRSENIKQNEGDKIFYFKNLDAKETVRIEASEKAIQKLTEDAQKMSHGKKDQTESPDMDDMIMVAQDLKFLSLEENPYPTVIGHVFHR